jgi:hypothetical protein
MTEHSASSADNPSVSGMTGGCQCGHVRYAFAGAPVEVTACHCRMCQKAVGGPFITLVQLKPDQIAWTRGTPGKFRSSSIATRLFCRDCGTPLAYADDDTGALEVTSGSLDEPARAVPTRATGTEAMLHWIGGVTSLPSKTTEQNYANRNKRPVVSFQHPDRDTPGDWTPPRDA